MRFSKRTFFSSVLFIFVFLLLVTYKLPFYIYKPGYVSELTEMIDLENAYPSKGELHLVTVSGGQATPMQYILAKLSSFHDLTPIEEARPKGMTDEEYMRHQLKMMENSQDASVYVAYQAAEKEAEIEFNGVYVINVVDHMPAKKVIEVGDRIMKVDEKEVKEAKDLIRYVETKNEGDMLRIEVDRQGERREELVEVSTFPKEEKVGIGIQLVTDQKVVVSPEVSIKSGNIGGPSAGIMFALEIYDQLKEEDITKGYQIAGTGEIDLEGNVYRIGGIDKKVVAAHQKGIDIFFAPNENGKKGSNYEEAKQTAEVIETKMEIVPIDSFNDALLYLEQLEPKTK